MATSTTSIISKDLPQEMRPHTYSIMYRLEETHWWFVGRRRIISSFLEPITRNSEQRQRILDVGCGTGANLELLSEFGEAEGIDVSPEALEFCRERGLKNVREGEAEHLPFPDDSFDLVTGLDVVEHLDHDLAGLKEMHRVLRPNGRALLFVPAFMFLWGVQDEVSNHRRRYTLPELKRLVREAGFEIERATYVNITFFLPILLGRLLMRLTGWQPESENNITIDALNGFFGRILAAETGILQWWNLPFGVSAICVARRVN
ncbi:MAG TPA: class I SAM-dependent methyltransferase [Pyrinomonadaceae bacterium]|nr:class I SAM-dependent methyltransferase [Pyrinomonadaceae bacterium]